MNKIDCGFAITAWYSHTITVDKKSHPYIYNHTVVASANLIPTLQLHQFTYAVVTFMLNKSHRGF